ncbi:MAG: UDP-2,4-diacetamido-2,4,6-trideoxy-beta-L-altropyranose hydrolase [Deltaproteobacteria bacterium]|nr:UDP-2,4-diacetamido-2,4,6-trideoxy-beta-L-altropyranose hydrolase [Deltaproteobacteria bacterium]
MTVTTIIRADGSTLLGYGHVFRTLVLAEELTIRGWKVVYVCRDLDGAPLSRIRDAGHGLVLLDADIDEPKDTEATARAAREAGASWIVVDRYATDEQAHALWRADGFKVLAIDDVCEHTFDVDILLNQNTDATELPYRTRADTVRLLGPRYALVRPAYRKARPAAPRKIDQVKQVMVFMGGGDPDDATGKVVEALGSLPQKLDVDVIVGSAYRYLERLQRLSEASPHRVRVLRDLPDLVEPMSRADVAIAAGGSVTWELCCMGVPMLLLPIADNQEGIACSLQRLGAAKRIGRSELIKPSELIADIEGSLIDADVLNRMAHACLNVVDGYGFLRVIGQLGIPPILLRRVRPEDGRLLFDWANDPDVRRAAVNEQEIVWAEHTDWLKRKLVASATAMWIGEWVDNGPIGQVRFDELIKGEAEVDVSVAREYRGRGLGGALIATASRMAFAETNWRVLHAHVKPWNVSSMRSFENAGFQNLGVGDMNGESMIHLILERYRGEERKH